MGEHQVSVGGVREAGPVLKVISPEARGTTGLKPVVCRKETERGRLVGWRGSCRVRVVEVEPSGGAVGRGPRK